LRLSRLARARQHPRQRPSRWPALTSAAVCLLPGLFLCDARDDLFWEALLGGADRAGHRLPG
jgi:hypothetical protein